jgi:uncharacterized membrane protein
MSSTQPSRPPGLFWLILVLGTVLRFTAVEHHSLWWDEAWQFEVSSAGSLRELFERHLNARISLNPPLSHLITWFFLQLGQSDFLLRLPSVVMGSLGVMMAFVLGRRLFGTTVGLWVMGATAFSPFHVYYSQEARLYAQLMLITLLSTWLLVRAASENRAGLWIAYALTITAGIYTHVYASFGILAHSVWILWFRRDRLKGMIASGFASVLLFGPMIVFFLKRLGALREPPGGAGASFANLPYTAFVYSVGLSMGPSVWELKQHRTVDALAPFVPLALLVIACFGVAVVSGIRETLRRPSQHAGALIVLSFVAPILGVFAVSFLPEMTYNVRYTAWAFPSFLIFLGSGLFAITQARRRLGWAVLVAVVVLWATSMGNYFSNPRYAKEDVRSAVAHWREHDAQRPLIAYNSWHTAKRYLTEEERRQLGAIWSRSNTAIRIRAIAAERKVREVDVLLARDEGSETEAILRREFPIVELHRFPGGVSLVQVRADSSSASASRS